MTWRDILEQLPTAISSGGIGSLITHIASRRKSRNDFISDLQNSITLLTENYTKTLDELTKLRVQNANLIVDVNNLQSEVSTLRKENETLIKKINELNKLLKIKAE